MNKKVFSEKQLKSLSAEEIIDKLQHDNYSLLKSLGAEKLRREMVPIGKICNAAINYVLGSTKKSSKIDEKERIKKARAKLLKHLKRLTKAFRRILIRASLLVLTTHHLVKLLEF